MMSGDEARNQYNNESFAEIKADLLNRKRELWNQIREDLERDAIEKHREIADVIREHGDVALEELRESNTLSLIGLKVEELEEIDQALNRIETDQYGRCIDCGEWINEERLKIMPYAVRCRNCKAYREEIENV